MASYWLDRKRKALEQDQYKRDLAEVEKLMDAPEGSGEEKRLVFLVDRIEQFENKYYPIGSEKKESEVEMVVYLAGSISGQKAENVIDYFNSTKALLERAGFMVLNPMTAKDYFRNDIKFKAEGYKFPPSTNHAIFERDRWMVSQCDVLYCNLTMAKIVSIGSMMELAWGSLLGKHTVVAMQSDNVHRHAFVLEAADIVWETHDEAIDYLLKFGARI